MIDENGNVFPFFNEIYVSIETAHIDGYWMIIPKYIYVIIKNNRNRIVFWVHSQLFWIIVILTNLNPDISGISTTNKFDIIISRAECRLILDITLLPPFFFQNSRLYCKKLVIHLWFKVLSIAGHYFLPSFGQHTNPASKKLAIHESIQFFTSS